MKSRIIKIILSILFFIPTMMQAQNYQDLWAAVQKASNDDLPKTALKHIVSIRQKATAENNQPQLLRALCTEFTLNHEVSPDSDDVVRRRIEDVLSKEERPVERALWQCALGTLTGNDTLLLAAVSQPEALAAAKATDYVPAFVIGKDSRYFSHDVLSVVTMAVLDHYSWSPEFRKGKVEAFQRMHDIYAQRGDEVAVLLCDFYDIENNITATNYDTATTIERMRRLLPQMSKSSEIAKTLNQWIAEKEQPWVNFDWNNPSPTFYPGTTIQAKIESRNVKDFELRLYRAVGISNTTIDPDADLAQMIKNGKRVKLAQSIKRPLQHDTACVTYNTTIDITLPEAGTYIAELLVEGRHRDVQWLHVTSVSPLFFSATSQKKNELRVTVIDAISGEPRTEGASVKYVTFGGNRYDTPAPCHLQWKEAERDENGNFVLPAGQRGMVTIAYNGDNFCPHATLPFSGYGFIGQNGNSGKETRLYTDRAIYRPGQKVQFGGLTYLHHNDEYMAVADVEGTVSLIDSENKTVSTLTVKSDKMGVVSGEFTLPDPVIPGRFRLRFESKSHDDATLYFSVEEYKRPTFRVILDEPQPKAVTGHDRWAVGDTLTLQGTVETFAGIAIPETTIKWTSTRHVWFWRSRDIDPERRQEGEVTTDSKGRFTVTIVLDEEGHYSTHIEATATNGETATADHSIYVGQRPTADNDSDEKEKFPLFTPWKSEDTSHATLALDRRSIKGDRLHVFYNIVSTQGGIIESRHICMTEDTLHFDLQWKSAYGDGATAYVAFVKDGTLYNYPFSVQRPLPNKKLSLQWSTFRDLLQPGEKETWTLTVKRPDGTPADASVMARLYDASLDAFTTSPWQFGLNFVRRLPLMHYSLAQYYISSLYYSKDLPDGHTPDYTHWAPSMFDYYASFSRDYGVKRMGRAMLAEAAAPMMLKSNSAPMAEEAFDTAAGSADGVTGGLTEEETAAVQQMDVRENFNETAFFFPALRTDADGNVAISFTLPESLTQWNFTALAHDDSMNYGILNDTIVARKLLTAEIAAPRFLRQGDKTAIPVTVRNLGDEDVTTEVFFVITDAATGKVLKSEKQRISLGHQDKADGKKNSETLHFALTADKDINVRVVAKTANSSDGEERRIPVLDGRETIQVSIPFSATKPGNIHIDLSPLHLKKLMKQDADCQPRLTVEYSANPLWNVIRVLPTLFEGEAYYATQWATRLYAIEVADHLVRSLAGTEAAVLLDSLLATSLGASSPMVEGGGRGSIPALRYSALHHLKDYQRGDGGFCWFKGFESSYWMTADISVLLARQQKMTGSTTATETLNRAMRYLDSETATLVKRMKHDKLTDVPEAAIRYLYASYLLGRPVSKDAQWLIDHLADEKKDLTMYGKGCMAQIVRASHPEEAALALESLIEHTVSTPEMGRYFDTERALGGWSSYKIPSQTMAIEALGAIDGAKHKEIQNEMKLWLLQSKRTQQWESSRASADATYALLHGDYDVKAPMSHFQSLQPEDYSRRQLTEKENAAAIKTDSYNIIKETSGLSWGAVFADYTLPIEQIEASSAGFTLTRQWEVLRDGKWQTIDKDVKIGEHVRQIITVHAERDYDFVQIEASRAACLEPLHPLSGTTWQGGSICYRMVRDSRNDYYFEHLSKGTHTLTEELIVDRSGTFTTGIARVQCTYAPEFGGYAPSFKVFATSK